MKIIGILDFTFDDYKTEPEKSEVLHNIKLKDQNGEIFYDKLTYIYLEMPNFKLAEAELKTRLHKWLFFIKHLEDFQTIPMIFKKEVIFEKAFEKAELARFSNAEWESYESSLKEYRDMKGYIENAFDEGKLEGKLEGIIEIAKKLKAKGFDINEIADATGLSQDEINRL